MGETRDSNAMHHPSERQPNPAERGSKALSSSELHDTELCEIVRTQGQQPHGAAAFAELYERHRDTVMAQAYRITDQRDRAEDLVEETFTRVLRALRGGHGPRTSVLGYLLVTLRGEAARSGAVERTTVAVAPETLEEIAEEIEPDFTEVLSERDQVSAAFAQLSEDARRVLWLVEVEQLPLEEAAEHLGLNIGALRVQLHRARKRLGTGYLQQYVEHSEPGCSPSSRSLARLARGELGKRERQRVEGHLEGCSSCSQQLARLRSLQRQLRNWVGPLIVGGGTGALLGGDHGRPAIAGQEDISAPWEEHGVASASASVAGKGLKVAGGLIILAGLLWVFWPSEQQEPAPSPVPPSTASDEPEVDTATRSDRFATGEEPARENTTGAYDLVPRDFRANGDQASDSTQRAAGDDTTRHWKLRE